MIFLKALQIENYRSIRYLEHEQFNHGLNIFIGQNNVGKSNIIKSLDVFFNQEKISLNDICKLSNEMDMTPAIRVKLNDFAEGKDLVGNFSENENKELLKSVTTKTNYSQPVFQTLQERIKFIYYSGSSDFQNYHQAIIEELKKLPIVERRKVISGANRYIREIFESGYTVSYDSEFEHIEIVDSFHDSDDLLNKSSGTQKVTILCLYISLLLNTDARKNYILAVDEPETSLHIGAQKKLFNLFKEISKKHQVFICTHPLAFVDRVNDENVFLINRKEVSETTIEKKAHKKENWLGLRDIMGADLSDTLLLNKFNLIVEGRTEQNLLPTVVEILNEYKLINLGNNELSFISAEGVDKISSFISVFLDRFNEKLAILVDNDSAGRESVKRIKVYKRDDVKNIPCFFIPENESNSDDKSIEDAFDYYNLLDSIQATLVEQNSFGNFTTEDQIADIINSFKEEDVRLTFKELEKQISSNLGIGDFEIEKIRLALNIKKVISRIESKDEAEEKLKLFIPLLKQIQRQFGR